MKKTIALTCILKDEVHNLPRFCESIAGLFDEYHFTDTGSKDGSVAWLMHEASNHLKCREDQLNIHHFQWCDNFAAARNYAIKMIKTDYWMWLDLDDVLFNPKAFASWREESINFGDVWYIPYHYALKEIKYDGEPAISFIRERIIKTDTGLDFSDFIHEGVDIRKSNRPAMTGLVESFSVKHLRTLEEMTADRGRNLRILEDQKDLLSPRLQFYYGKELFDAKRFEDGIRVLRENVKHKEMEQGDRVMAFQFLIHALLETQQFGDAIKYGVLGIQMEPNRAEYHCMVAEAYVRMGETHKAIPFFGAAKYCHNVAAHGVSHEFTFSEGYSYVPRMNLANIYAQQGRFEEAVEELKPLTDQKAQEIRAFCEKGIADTKILPDDALLHTNDIIITCPHAAAYPWDEKIYRENGLGGSETAAVEMAMHLKKLTGSRVIIFQQRDKPFTAESGVEYIPAPELHGYFQKYKPKLHIAWRHTARFTNAMSLVWSHDLRTPGAKDLQNYDYILALSETHKTFLMGMEGVPAEKIIVTRNGIDPKRFQLVNNIEKKPGKVIWPNSPDRGLEYAVKVMDLVRKEIPTAELHVFYGFNNMDKFGMKEQADKLRLLFTKRDWIKYRGNVDQETLSHEMMSSDVWLYTSTFFETYCISAVEALSARCWPVVRKFGALKSTMKDAEENGWADILDVDMSDETVPLFADKVIKAIQEKKHERIEFDPESVSWSSLAEEWCRMFNLK